MVKKLKCSVCTKFQVKIISRRNFSDHWNCQCQLALTIQWLLLFRTIQCMLLFRTQLCTKEQHTWPHPQQSAWASDVSAKKREREGRGQKLLLLCSIAIVLSTHLTMRKSDYERNSTGSILWQERKLSFRKYPRICELEPKHGVK